MTDNLLTIKEVVIRARSLGVSFGHGDPRIHLAYLTKLHILPQTVRRKVNGDIVGCYPESVISTLQFVEDWKDRGMTYSQIRFRLQNSTIDEGKLRTVVEDGKSKVERQNSKMEMVYPRSSTFSPYSLLLYHPSSSVAFLLIGLLIGYLVAINRAAPGLVGQNVATPVVQAASALPIDSDSQTLAKLTSVGSSPQQPIYVIAMPKQNLDKIGKVDINSLIKN